MKLACFLAEIRGGVVAEAAEGGGDGERREEARGADEPA